MPKEHFYKASVRWTGNRGTGTSDYKAYGRDHEISGDGGKDVILGSADPIYRGDASRYNPEELIVAAIAGCHMLWYLHLCADAGVVVVDYTDDSSGTLRETDDGNGHFSEVTIRPQVTISAESDPQKALQLHAKAHEFCFIANSMRFPVYFEPTVVFAHDQAAVNRVAS